MKNFQLKSGLREHVADGTEFQLGAIIDWKKYSLSDLPTEFWTIPLSIKDQNKDGNDDFCASATGAGMIEPKEFAVLFYPYIFAAAKFVTGQDPDSWGLTLKDIGKALTKWGCPEVKDVPDEVKNLSYEARRRFENYPDWLKEKAMVHRQQTYFFLDKSPYDPFDTARMAIWLFKEKIQKIAFGVQFGWGIQDYILDGIQEGFGHAMWNSGWDKDGLVVVNSAGLTAGKNGMHRITRDTFNFYAKKYGLMMIVDLPRADAEFMIENNVKLEDLKGLYKALLLLKQLLAKIDVNKIINNFKEVVGAVFSKRQD